MAIPYQNIAKVVALRAGLIADGDQAAREALYAAASIAAGIDGVEVPYSALKQDILAAEKELASMIGNISNSIYRVHLVGQSANLTTGAVIPTFDSLGRNFVGSFDGLYDTSTGYPFTETTKQQVLRRNDNAGGFFKLTPRLYCIDGTRIFFTGGSNAVMRGCAFSAATAAAAFVANSDSVLPMDLEALWACMVLAGLSQEDWFVPEAGVYRALVEQKTVSVITGRERLMTMPQIPTKTSSVEPGKD